MVQVSGEIECESAEVARDEWVPLTVYWWPRRQMQPLYLRITGTDGGEVELKLDPENGALVELIVIEEPPSPTSDTASLIAPLDVREGAVPLLDRAAWLDEEGAIPGVGMRPVIEEEQPLSLVRDLEGVSLRFSQDAAVRRICCDRVAVGIAADRSMTSVDVAFT